MALFAEPDAHSYGIVGASVMEKVRRQLLSLRQLPCVVNSPSLFGASGEASIGAVHAPKLLTEAPAPEPEFISLGAVFSEVLDFAALVSTPEFLAEEAKLEWSRVSEQLFRLGLLSHLDRTSLAAYCQAFARWKQAETAIAELAKRDQLSHGLMINTSNGNLIQNPLVGTANKAMSEMMRYAVEFGMTPSARSRVDAGVSFDGGKFAGLLGPREDPAERHFRDIDRPGALVDFIASNPANRRPQ